MNNTVFPLILEKKKLPRLVLFGHLQQYNFQFYSTSGDKLLTSDDFPSAILCIQAMIDLKNHPPSFSAFEKNKSITGQHFYVVKGRNGKRLGASGWYWSEAACDFARAILVGELSQAELIEE